MNNITLIVIGVGSIVFLVGLIPSYLTIAEIVRVHRTPTSYIAGLPFEGQVEVYAEADGKKVYSPITRTACIFWHLSVEQIKSGGSRTSGWSTSYQDMSGDSFYISDETGKIEVKLGGADLIVYENMHESSGLLKSLDAETRHALEEIGFDTETVLGFNKSFRVYEQIIEPGKKVYVLGQIGYENGERIITTKPSSPLIVSDRSERDLLGTLYGRVAANIFMLALLTGVIILMAN
jgi:hypothetical protein